MNTRKYQIPEIPKNEHTMVVDQLLEIIKCLKEDVDMLKAELNRTKNLKNKPKITCKSPDLI